MTNKLVAIINSLKVLKIKKILLYEIKFLVPNYRCLQNPRLGGYRPKIPVLSVLCPQLNLLNPPTPEQNSWLRHCASPSLYGDRFLQTEDKFVPKQAAHLPDSIAHSQLARIDAFVSR